jgi:hypothetical protein
MSVREIAHAVSVSRGTASLWLRDVPLTEAQRLALRERNPACNGTRNGSAEKADRARERRRAWQEAGQAKARRRDPDYLAGCALYWAEGWKSRNQVHFVNSDPWMIRLFAGFLRDHFSVSDNQLRVTCNLFADHLERQREIEDFWLSAVGVPRGCLLRSRVNVYSRRSKRKRTNLLPYGTCKVVVNSTEIAQTILGSIQELGGFDRPEWLG